MRKRRGASAVEFAILLPVLVLLTFAIFDYSWYFVTNQSIHRITRDAVRVGAQTSMENDPLTSASDTANNLLANSFPANTMDSTIESKFINDDSMIQVDIDLDFKPLLGNLSEYYMPDTIEWSATRILEEQ